jgi:hypothetical protein
MVSTATASVWKLKHFRQQFKCPVPPHLSPAAGMLPQLQYYLLRRRNLVPQKTPNQRTYLQTTVHSLSVFSALRRCGPRCSTTAGFHMGDLVLTECIIGRRREEETRWRSREVIVLARTCQAFFFRSNCDVIFRKRNFDNRFVGFCWTTRWALLTCIRFRKRGASVLLLTLAQAQTQLQTSLQLRRPNQINH